MRVWVEITGFCLIRLHRGLPDFTVFLRTRLGFLLLVVVTADVLDGQSLASDRTRLVGAWSARPVAFLAFGVGWFDVEFRYRFANEFPPRRWPVFDKEHGRHLTKHLRHRRLSESAPWRIPGIRAACPFCFSFFFLVNKKENETDF